MPGFWEETLGNLGEESKCYLKRDDHQPAKHCDSFEDIGFSVCIYRDALVKVGVFVHFKHAVGIIGDTDPSGKQN